MDLAGGTPLIIRRLIVPLTVAAFAACAVQANAQGAFPAPLPGQAASPFPPVNGATPANNASPFPPVNGAAPAASFGQPSAFPSNGAAPIAGGAPTAPMAAPSSPGAAGPSEACMKGFVPLREEAEKRGKLIKAAMERHAQPDEACKLIESYSKAEIKMIEYVKLNTAKCGIPPQISEQMKKGHEGTQATLKKCTAASQAQAQRGPAGPSLSEVLGSSAALPEATATKKGGSTFDTLNGNVLAR
jgi:hypothetical protein